MSAPGPETDRRFMALALMLGRRGRGACWPNPAVGCVIVAADGRIVGRGHTQPGGRPHAERVALDRAGVAAHGATAYVTLEPCAHHGHTPPCAEALVNAGVARMVVALGDPDPRVSGRGLKMLRDAGVAVCTGLMEDRAARDLQGFLLRVTEGRPCLTLKLASSFDGRIATASGESRWITSAAARRAVHAMRATHDAVMVGGGTVRADDPDLTVRGLGVARQPVRVAVSRRLDINPDSRLGRTAGEVPVWLCHGPDAGAARRDAWARTGAQLLECDLAGAHLDPASVLRALGAAGLTTVFCEGGGSWAASLLTAGAVDRLAGFTAGCALGAEGQPAIGAMGLEKLALAPRFVLEETRALDGDVLHLWHRG